MTTKEYLASYMALLGQAQRESISEFKTAYELACKLLVRYNRYYKYVDIPNVFNDKQRDVVKANWAQIREDLPKIREFEINHGTAIRQKVEAMKQEFDKTRTSGVQHVHP